MIQPVIVTVIKMLSHQMTEMERKTEQKHLIIGGKTTTLRSTILTPHTSVQIWVNHVPYGNYTPQLHLEKD